MKRTNFRQKKVPFRTKNASNLISYSVFNYGLFHMESNTHKHTSYHTKNTDLETAPFY